jgi:hypothetical protein
MALESTLPLTEMSTRNLPGGKSVVRLVTSPKVLHGLLQGWLYLFVVSNQIIQIVWFL